MPNDNEKNENSFLDKLTFYFIFSVIGINQTVDLFDNIMRFKGDLLELLKWLLQSTGADDFIRKIILNTL